MIKKNKKKKLIYFFFVLMLDLCIHAKHDAKITSGFAYVMFVFTRMLCHSSIKTLDSRVLHAIWN